MNVPLIVYNLSLIYSRAFIDKGFEWMYIRDLILKGYQV